MRSKKVAEIAPGVVRTKAVSARALRTHQQYATRISHTAPLSKSCGNDTSPCLDVGVVRFRLPVPMHMHWSTAVRANKLCHQSLQPGDQRHIFLWTVKTLHGANLNNHCTKKRYYAVSQSK